MVRNIALRLLEHQVVLELHTFEGLPLRSAGRFQSHDSRLDLTDLDMNVTHEISWRWWINQFNVFLSSLRITFIEIKIFLRCTMGTCDGVVSKKADPIRIIFTSMPEMSQNLYVFSPDYSIRIIFTFNTMLFMSASSRLRLSPV